MSARSSGGWRLAAIMIVALAGCSSQKSRAPESQAGEAPADAAGAELPDDAFGPMPMEEAEAEDEDARSDLDELASIRADLERYEAQLWRVGVPVRAYAQRPNYDDAAAARTQTEGGDKPAKDAKARDRSGSSPVAPAPEPTGRPSTKSGKESRKAKKSNKPDGGGGRLGDLAKNEGDDSDRCETVCELAAAICEIEAHVCDMADRHAADVRYTDACERAADDCKVATQACQACSAG